MSTPAPRPTEEQVQEDLLRLDAYRNQLNALLQQHQILSASRQDHGRARESLEGVDRAPANVELLLPLGGETFVRGSVDRSAPVLVGVGSGIVVEMERPKVVELLAERSVRIDQALRDLEGQMGSLDERIQALSNRLDAIARESGATDVGGV
ncbi:MAG: prefoldin subunit alpha [Thermoplasmata archaeon]|jgi:prefoldin alpha subunit